MLTNPQDHDLNSSPQKPSLKTLLAKSKSPLIMAILNVSPESFFQGSVSTSTDELLRAGELALKNGAVVLDVGAMSTAPYKETQISESVEAERMEQAVAALRLEFPEALISADTSRKEPAVAALSAGATILNDVHGFFKYPELATIAADAGAEVILMANESQLEGNQVPASPERVVMSLFQGCLHRARQGGLHDGQIVLDPGIGFFRNGLIPWHEVDLQLIRSLPLMTELGFPLLVSVSRKSFLGKLLGREQPQDRLAGSLAATLACIEGGARIIRTHDVAETRDALTFWEHWKQ